MTLLLLFLASSACAQGGLYSGVVWRYTPAGAFPAGGAQITVCSSAATGAPCTPTVSVFQDSALLIQVPNPLDKCTSLGQVGCLDNLGNFSFFVSPNVYIYSVSGAGLTPYSTTISVSGVGPAGSPAAPLNAVQKNGGSNFAASSATDDAGGYHFKGPNPYVDATAYGVRAVNPNTTPAAVGLTANCTNGSAVCTISAASTWVNGDGLVIYGAGAPHAMTTPGAPTVQPSLAKSGTGTGDVVNDLVGATTYNYQVIARRALGGLTAASAVGSTTGSATLGAQTPVSLTSCSRANDVVTCVTSSAHALVTNAMIYMTGVADTTFDGWYLVSGSADNTHFTFVSGLDTRNGATTATTGGTVKGYNCNHVSWSSVAGAYEYYIYGRTGGSLTLRGVSRIVNGSFTEGSLYWDDFGSPMMDGTGSFPAYVPNTPPGAATSDHLVTTIVSGAGTTTLTLANAAGTTVSGATIRFDNYPTVLAAVQANYSGIIGPPIYFPTTTLQYVFNSYADLSANGPSLVTPSGLWLNDTLNLGGTGKLFGGTTTPAKGSQTAFQQESLPTLECVAIPCIQLPNANLGPRIEGLNIVGLGTANNNLLVMQDSGSSSGGASYSRVYFTTSTSNGDYMGMAIYARGQSGTQAAAFDLDRVNFSGGPTQVDASTATPFLFCDDCGDIRTKNLMFNRRGVLYRPDPAGASFKADRMYMQGGITPLLILSSPRAGNTTLGTIEVSQITLDTMPHPIIAYLPGGGIFTPTIKIFPILGANSNRSSLSGNPMSNVINFGLDQNALGQNKNSFSQYTGRALDGFFFTNTSGGSGSATSYRMNAAIAVGTGHELFIDSNPPAPPTCVVSAGGSVPITTLTYKVVPVWQNGGEGNYSPACPAVTTTGGNQTVTVTWVSVTGSCKGYNVYRNGAQIIGTQPNVSGCASTSYVDTAASAFGTSAGSLPAGGPTMLMPGVQGIATPKILVGGDTSFSSSPRGTFSGLALVLNATGRVMGTIPDTPVTVTAITFTVPNGGTVGAGCGTAPQVRVTDGTNLSSLLTLNNGAGSGSLTGLSTNYPAAADMRLEVVIQSAGCGTQWTNVNFVVQYKMQ